MDQEFSSSPAPKAHHLLARNLFSSKVVFISLFVLLISLAIFTYLLVGEYKILEKEYFSLKKNMSTDQNQAKEVNERHFSYPASWVRLDTDLIPSSIEIYHPINFELRVLESRPPCTDSSQLAFSYPQAPTSMQDPEPSTLAIILVMVLPNSENCPLKPLAQIEKEINKDKRFLSVEQVEINGQKFIKVVPRLNENEWWLSGSDYYTVQGNYEYRISLSINTHSEDGLTPYKSFIINSLYEDFVDRLNFK